MSTRRITALGEPTELDDGAEFANARRGAERRRRPVIRVTAGIDAMAFAVVRSGATVTIGRDPECALRCQDASVSRVHAAIRHVPPGALILEDHGSMNGTFVGATLVTRPTPLVPGNALRVGNVPMIAELLTDEEIAQLSDIAARLRDTPRDNLTGLLARRYLDDVIAPQLPGLEQAGIPVSLALIDPDGLDRINRNLGTRVGDAALRVLGRLAQEEARANDRAIRYDGAQIAVVLANCDESGALGFAERLRSRIATHDWSATLRPVGGRSVATGALTVSIGVAQAQAGEPVAPWILRATRALYVAKRLGRDRAVPSSAAP